MKHNRFTALFVIVLLALLMGIVGIVGAEDQPTAGDAPPAATVEATLAVIAPDGSTTPVRMTLPAAVDSALANQERAFWVFVVVALIVIIIAREMHHNTQIKDMVSLETARKIYNEAAGFFDLLTARIPGRADDAIKNIALGIWDEQLKNWEASRSPASTTTINVNPAQPETPAATQFSDPLAQASPG
jgi:hypothetical protein